MFGIGSWELIIILILALIVLGPAKLPEVARTLGKGLASLRRSADEVKKELDLDGVKKEFEKIEQDAGIDDLKRMVDVRGEVRRALADLDDPLTPLDASGKTSTPGTETSSEEPGTR